MPNPKQYAFTNICDSVAAHRYPSLHSYFLAADTLWPHLRLTCAAGCAVLKHCVN